MSTTYYFMLPGITCINCVKPVLSQLESNKTIPIETYDIDVVNKRLSVTVSGQEFEDPAIRASLRDLVEDVGVECVDSLPPPLPFYRSHWFLGTIGTISGIILLILSLALGGIIPLAAMISIGAISTLLTLILGAHSYYHAWLKLYKSQTLTMDTLFAISTVTILVVSIIAFFVPWMPMMFEAGLLIFGFRHLGLAIEDSIKQKMGLDKSFQNRLPAKVRVEGKGETELKLVTIDDVLLINPGEIIPLDGICLSEDILIDDNIITGSIVPRHFKRGERLLSGMKLPAGSPPLLMQVKASLQNSYLARLDKNLGQIHTQKAPLEEISNKILQYFIPGVLAVAIISGIIIGCLFPPALAIQCAVTVLVSACPCILGLIIPLAVKIGAVKAAEHGVHFKHGKALQAANEVDAVIFDLNGTLTTGVPEITNIVSLDPSFDKSDISILAAILERESNHQYARAIYNKGLSINKELINSSRIDNLNKTNHSGIQGIIGPDEYAIGNQALMDDLGVNTAAYVKNLSIKAGENVVFLAKNKKPVGYFVLTDPLRKDALQTISVLQQSGKKIFICTGADQATANRYANLLGIPLTNVRAGCVGMQEQVTDNTKIAYIKSLQSQGLKVAMVGDAANDTLALSASDFGIAIKSNAGDEIAQQEAGAVITGGALLPVANALAIAKQTVTNIKQSLIFSLAYNMVVVGLTVGLLVGLGFAFPPAAGVALMILQTSLVFLLAYHFKQKSLEHLENQEQFSSAEESYNLYKSSLARPEAACENGLQNRVYDQAHFENPVFNSTCTAAENDEQIPLACNTY